MRAMWMCLAMVSAIVIGLPNPTTASATPASGFASTTLGVSRFPDGDVFNLFVPKGGDPRPPDRQTKRSSDLYVQSNLWQPGGSTGWHSHPGRSLIIVTAGTVTDYEPDAPGCKPTAYTKGMGFIDPGGSHAHNIRNEGAVPASTIAVQLIPEGAKRRVDAPQPPNCPVF